MSNLETKTDGDDSGQNMIKLVTFLLNEEYYAVDIIRVQEIINMQKLTGIPQAAEAIEGIINLRGSVIPVMDLKKKLGLGSVTETDQTRIIVVEHQDDVVGMIVDGISQVIEIDGDSLANSNSSKMSIDNTLIKGIGKVADDLVIVLDLDRVVG
jgi:purine-binding chemotaxis protein CheW